MAFGVNYSGPQVCWQTILPCSMFWIQTGCFLPHKQGTLGLQLSSSFIMWQAYELYVAPGSLVFQVDVTKIDCYTFYYECYYEYRRHSNISPCIGNMQDDKWIASWVGCGFEPMILESQRYPLQLIVVANMHTIWQWEPIYQKQIRHCWTVSHAINWLQAGHCRRWTAYPWCCCWHIKKNKIFCTHKIYFSTNSFISYINDVIITEDSFKNIFEQTYEQSVNLHSQI